MCWRCHRATSCCAAPSSSADVFRWRDLVFAVALVCTTGAYASIARTVHIDRGIFTTVHGTTFPWLAFNSTPLFDPLNAVIVLSPGDVLELTVVNNDTTVHGIAIAGVLSQPGSILPGDSLTVELVTTIERNYIYSDPTAYPKNTYLGLAGMICVTAATSQVYFWNIKEHERSFNDTLASGGTVDWSTYDPDYFTINGLSHPDLQNDLTAKINCTLGDTVRIFVTNTGQSAHAIHFHGFHCTALYNSDALRTGWSKDTWPLRSMQCALLEFVADKVGRYSVHDHNLVAVSGGGTHPNGMFIITDVVP